MGETREKKKKKKKKKKTPDTSASRTWLVLPSTQCGIQTHTNFRFIKIHMEPFMIEETGAYQELGYMFLKHSLECPLPTFLNALNINLS